MTAKKQSDQTVPLEHIQLPPEELTEQLDNAPAQPAEPTEAERPKIDIADLDFVSDPETRGAPVPLQHAFRWKGQEVKQILVRRLTVAEVGQLASKARGGSMDLYEIYAAQTGLPAPVLRGLMDDDGDAVTEKCQDFFPRVFRTDVD